MPKKLFQKLNKKAFTLIEILLAVALLTVAMVAVGGIIISTQNNTAQMFNETELQQQLVEVQETIHNEILGTNTGVKLWKKQTDTALYELTDTVTGDEHEIVVAFYNLDTKDYNLTKTYYRYRSEEKTLETAVLEQNIPKDKENEVVVSVDDDIATTLFSISEWNTTSTCVENFTIDLSNYSNNRLVGYTIEIGQNDISYPTDDTVYLRNDVDVNETLTIEKYHTVKIAKPKIENLRFTYDGMDHAPSEVNYLERFVTRTSDSVMSAKNAGTYTVTYVLKDKDLTTWEDGSTGDLTYTWEIGKRIVTLTWGDTFWTYDGEEHSTTCVAGNVVEGEDCGLWLEGNKVGPDAGTRTCTARLDNSNYGLPPIKAVTLEIVPASASVDIWTVNRTYNETVQNLVGYSNLIGGTLKFYVSTSATAPTEAQLTSTSCTATDAGDYHIWYKVDSNSGNYIDTEMKYLGVSTIMRLNTAKFEQITGLVYNGQEQAGVHGEFVNITGTPKATNAGTYTTSGTPDKNHLWEDGTDDVRSITWSIGKANATCTAPKANTLTYNGNSQALVTAGSTSHGKMQYSLDGINWSDSIPTGVNAGTYNVFYYATGDDNHIETSKKAHVNVTINKKKAASYTATTEFTYDGTKKTAIVASNAVISGENSATNAGKYTAYVVPGSNYEWADGSGEGKKSVDWEIIKASGSCKAPVAKVLTYTGEAQALVTAGSTDYGKMQYSLDGNTWTDTVPTGTNAGSYKVYYYSTGDNDHEPTDKSEYVNVTITKRKAAVLTASDKIYNGNKQIGVSYEYIKDGTGTLEAINAGEYTYSAYPADNYQWKDGTGTVKKTVTWKIAKAQGTCVAPKALDLTFNGTDQTLISAGTTNFGEMKYSLDKTNWSTSLPKGKAAGTYKVYYYSTGDADHEETSKDAFVEVKIKTAKGAYVTRANRTYNGSKQNGYTDYKYVTIDGDFAATDAGEYTFTATLNDPNYIWADGSTVTTKTFSWSIARAKSATYTKSNYNYTGSEITGVTGTNVTITGNYKGTNVGQYTAYVTPTANYQWSDGTGYGEKEVTWNILKVAGSCAAPTALNLTYNGSNQVLIKAGSTNYGKMQYSLDGVTWTDSLPTGKDAGKYTVYYYSTGDSNHEATSKGTSVVVEIKLNSGAKLSATDLVYNGKSQTGVTYANIKGGSGNLSATDVGEYKYSAYPADNYQWNDGTGTGLKTVTWKITRSPSATYNIASGLVYNEKTQVGATATNATITGQASAVNAGKYVVKITPGANYAWSDGTYGTVEKEWEIARRAAAVLTATNKTYTGSTQTGVTSAYVKDGSGTASAIAAGSYTYSAYPDDNHTWKDGSGTGKKTVSWSIEKAVGSCTAPTAKSLTYTGSAQALVNAGSTSYGSMQYSLNGTNWSTSIPTGKDAGDYKVYYYSTGDDNHAATDKTKYVSVTIAKKAAATLTASDKTYNGNLQTGVSAANIKNGSGTKEATNVGNYSYSAYPADNYEWKDGSGTGQKTVTWKITSNNSASYSINTGLVYNGAQQTGVTGTNVTITGTASATAAGTYSVTITPKANYAFSNGSTDAITKEWTIERAASSVLTASDSVYTGQTITGVTSANIKDGSGTKSAINVGEYSYSAYPADNYQWKDGTGTGKKTVSWKITTNNSASYTIKNNLIYNGSQQTGVTGTNVTITGTASATVAGTYSVTITPKANYAFSNGSTNAITKEWSIARSATATLTASDKTYTGSSQTGVTYANIKNGTGTASAINVGSYSYSAYPADNYSWSDGSGTGQKTVSWKITEIAGSCTAPTAKTLTYTGSAQALVNAGSTSYGSMQYSTDGTNWSTSIPTGTNAGDYKVYYYSTGDTNHAATDKTKYVSVTIARKASATLTASDKTYTGSSQTGVSSSNIKSGSGTKSATNVGSYSYSAYPADNYSWSDGSGTGQKTVSWKINKATGSCTAPTAKSLTYTGSAQTLINAGSTSYGSMQYSTDGTNWSTSLPKGTNAGTYTVYYYSTGDDNHNATSKTKSISVTIAKSATASLSASNKNYTGKSQTGVTYANIKNGSGTASATNAGDYSYSAYPADNYTWSDGSGTGQKTVSWKINKVAGSCTAPTAKSLTYTGNAQTLINAGSTSYGSMQYSTDGTNWSTSLPTGTKGTIKVYYYSTGDTNHNATAKTNYISVTIARARWSTVSGDGSEYQYTGSAITGLTGANVTWTGTRTATAVGSYSATATPYDVCAWADGTYASKTLSWKIIDPSFSPGETIILMDGARSYNSAWRACTRYKTYNWEGGTNLYAVIDCFHHVDSAHTNTTKKYSRTAAEADTWAAYVEEVRTIESGYYYDGSCYLRLDEIIDWDPND